MPGIRKSDRGDGSYQQAKENSQSTNLFETGIRPIIDEYLLELSREKRDYGSYWSASSAGYCMRKNIFDRLQVPYVVEDARKQRVFTSGNVFHSWIQDITKQAGLSIAQELEVIDEDLKIKGHIDDLVLIEEKQNYVSKTSGKRLTVTRNQHLILYDYKTRNSKNFNYSKQPSHFHRMQTGTYMYMLRMSVTEKLPKTVQHAFAMHARVSEARVLNISKDDLRMSEVQYLYTEELEKEIVDYWSQLNKFWADKKLPPCTCHEHNGGFMATERYNPYFYNGEPCSLEWFKKHPEAKEKWENEVK